MKTYFKILSIFWCSFIWLTSANAQLVSTGSETKANTTTTNSQQRPAAAMDANGNYTLVWESQDQDGSGFGIYAQRYNNTGIAQGSEFQVNTTTTKDQRFPAVAMDSDGDFVIIWQSFQQDGDGWGIYGQRYNNSGVVQGTEFAVNATTLGQQRFPKVAMDANGQFIVAWESNFEIKAQRYNSGGTAQGSEISVNTTTANAQNYPDVAMDNNGDFAIVWQSFNQDGNGFGVYGQRYDNAGSPQAAEFLINTTTSNNQLDPVISMDAEGNFVVAWVSNTQDGSQEGIYAQRYNAAGGQEGSEFLVNTTTSGAQDNPAIDLATTGKFVVTWNSYGQDGSFFGVYAQAFTKTGTTVGSEVLINTTTTLFQQFPAFGFWQNDLVIAWQDGQRSSSTSADGSNYGIYFQRFSLVCDPPQAICQHITAQLDATGNAGIIANQVDGGSTADCGLQNLVVAPSAFTCANTGINTVTLTVTDNDTNTGTCTATVTVQDNIPPLAQCQNVTTQLDASGNATLMAATVDNSSSDACGMANLTLDKTNFTCSDVGSNTVILTATDNNNNSATCSATVTVQDNIAPSAQCQNVTAQLDASGNITVMATMVDNGSSDACGIANLALDIASFTCTDIGPNMVKLTAMDNNNNSATCSATVTIQDNVPPLAQCQNITAQLDGSGNTSVTAIMVDNNSSDACGMATLSLDQTNFTCANVGPNTVTLTATDNNNNSATCTATVTVQDNIAPTALCQNVTTQLDATGNTTVTTAMVDNNSSDACGIANLALDKTNFTCSDIGSNTVILTATDNYNNSATCSATVTIQDNNAPSAQCQDATVQLDAAGNANISAATVNNSSGDACGIANLSINSSSFTCANVGPNTVILTATDNNNNSASCTATVTIQDNVAPSAQCQNITVQLDAGGNASISSGMVDNASNDACGINSLSLDQTSFSCTNVGPNTVTLTATDNNNNSATCTATVTIQDNIAPVAQCQNATVQLDANGNATLPATSVDNGSNDACGISTSALDNNGFDCTQIGNNNSVILTVTDNNGNTATCTANVTVQDVTQPSINCPTDLSVNTEASNCETTVTLETPASNDNCAVATLQYRYRPVDANGNDLPGQEWSAWIPQSNLQLTLEIGYWKIQWQAIDAANNQQECHFIITVLDSEPPNPVCFNPTLPFNGEEELNLQIAQVWDEIASSDNCPDGPVPGGDVYFVGMSPNMINCNQVGSVVPVTVTVEDASGNNSQCTAMVTVGGLPCGWSVDSGGVDCPTNTGSYDPNTATFSLTSEGCYSQAFYRPTDPHGFIQRELCGDGEISAQVVAVNGNGWAGISMRESNDPAAPMIQLMLDGNNLTRREVRQNQGGTAFVHQFQTNGKNWLRLTRTGNQFNAYHSLDGAAWELVFSTAIPMSNCIQIGMITMNGMPTGTVTGAFDNVNLNGNGNNLQVSPSAITPHPSEVTVVGKDLKIYPNPTSGQAYVDLNSFMGEDIQLNIYQVTGQKMRSISLQNVQEPAHLLDLSGFHAGTYLVEVVTKRERITKRLVLVEM